MAIGVFGSQFQFAIHFIEQVFRFLGVPIHIPFIGFLGSGDLFPGLPAKTLGGGEIWMVGGRNILFGPLRHGGAADHKKTTKNSS